MQRCLLVLAVATAFLAQAASAATPPTWTIKQATINVTLSNPQLWGKQLVGGDYRPSRVTAARCVGLGKPTAGRWAAFRCSATYAFVPAPAQTATVWFYAQHRRPGAPTSCFSVKGLAAIPASCRKR